MINYSDKRQFLGTFNKNQKSGIGAIYHKGKLYVGEYSKGKRTGYGEVYQHNKNFHKLDKFNITTYDFAKVRHIEHSKRGYYIKGRLEGYGEFSIPEKKYCYFGWFKDGNYEGDGVETTAEDTYYG